MVCRYQARHLYPHGGNLLLDIGPKADGSIPQGHFYGPTTLSKDSSTLYLFLPGKTSGQVAIKGLNNNIKAISVAGNGARLTHKGF